MAKYIEVEAFTEFLLGMRKALTNNGEKNYISSTKVSDLIKRFPAADVQGVRHGRWQLTKSGYWYECSLCGCVPDNYPFKYCPNCGAIMTDEE